MRKVFCCLTALAGLAMAASCTLNKLEQPVAGGAEGMVVSFTATVPQADTKAVVHEGESGPEVYWSPGDQVYVYREDWGWSTMASQNTEPSPTATFSGSVYGAAGEIDAKHKIWALYPRLENENVSFYPDSLIVPMHFIQNPVEGSFDPQSLLMLAQTTTRELAFYHVGGGFKFKVSGDWIRQVEFRSNDGTPLAGQVVVKMDGEGRPQVVKVEEGVSSILMTMPGSECFKPDTWYYMNMLPAVLEKGYTMFFRSETQTGKVVVSDAREIKRAVWASLKDDVAADANAVIKAETNIFRNEIRYKTSDENTIVPTTYYGRWNGSEYVSTYTEVFGAEIVSNTYADGEGVIVFDGPVTSINDVAFQGASTLTEMTIPITVRKVGYNAFYSCDNLVRFKGPWASIDGRCLIICGKLVAFAEGGLSYPVSYEVEDGVISLADGVFDWCRFFKEVTLPESLEEVGIGAFHWCNRLEAFHGKFASDDGHFLIKGDTLLAAALSGETDVIIPGSVKVIAPKSVGGCREIERLTLSEGITTIGDCAFENSQSIEEVYLPESLTTVGLSPFRYDGMIKRFYGKFASEDGRFLIVDGDLIAFAARYGGVVQTSCTIPNEVRRIRGFWCPSDGLTELIIPEGINEICDQAFWSLYGLTSITIPASVTKIGTNILQNCNALTSITVRPIIPPTMTTDEHPLGWLSAYPPICVPAGSLEAYQSAKGWRYQSNYQAIAE